MEKIMQIFNWSIGNITLGMIVKTLLLFFICITVAKVIIKRVYKKLDESEHIEKGLHTFIKSIVKIVIYFIIVLIIAESLNIPVTSLVALFSVVGLAVSLSIQNTLSNLASGVMLFITKPFVSGDYIEVAGVGGTVEEIRLTYTKLISPNKQVILIPNSEVGASKITNYSTEPTRRMEIKINVSYDEKINDVKEALKAVVASNKLVLTDPEPFIRLSDYKDSSIEYVLRAWAKNTDYWTAYFDVLEKIKEEFDSRGIKMTYNHVNVHMLKD